MGLIVILMWVWHCAALGWSFWLFQLVTLVNIWTTSPWVNNPAVQYSVDERYYYTLNLFFSLQYLQINMMIKLSCIHPTIIFEILCFHSNYWLMYGLSNVMFVLFAHLLSQAPTTPTSTFSHQPLCQRPQHLKLQGAFIFKEGFKLRQLFVSRAKKKNEKTIESLNKDPFHTPKRKNKTPSQPRHNT